MLKNQTVTEAMNIIWCATKLGMNLTWKIWVITIIILNKEVLLLSDVFEKFIDTCLKFYKLDPFHYFNSPGLSWDVMLKMNGENKKQIQILTCICLLKND